MTLLPHLLHTAAIKRWLYGERHRKGGSNAPLFTWAGAGAMDGLILEALTCAMLGLVVVAGVMVSRKGAKRIF